MDIARLLSTVFQPVLTGVYVLVLMSLLDAATWRGALGWGLLTSVLAAGLPAADLARRVRARTVTDFELALRQERLRPLVVALLASGLTLVVVAVFDGPRSLVWALVAALVTGAVLTITTVWWKISFHAAAVAGGVLLLGWRLGAWSALLLPLVPAVGWSRVALGRHTVTQAAAGALAGMTLTALVLAAARHLS
ncbi:MAG: hypothetical protein Kow00122_14710 [Thermoleophilia bacterium]